MTPVFHTALDQARYKLPNYVVLNWMALMQDYFFPAAKKSIRAIGGYNALILQWQPKATAVSE